MSYNRETRNELYKKFVNKHSPSAVFVLKNGVHCKEVFDVITGYAYSFDEHQQQVYSDLQKSIDGYEHTPSKFFKDNYRAVVSLCAGGKEEEKLLYAYFDKLNKFPYSVGISRRSVRTATYIDPVDSVKRILSCAYHMQIYNTTLDRYLLDDMGPRELDYKKNSGRTPGGVDDLIAAHLDGGDTAVKEALIKIITGENNSAFITVDIIRGIIKSDDGQLHRLLGQLLLAARLQEGLRQAICENMDCGTAEAFKTLFEVIENNNLIRFSSVRRAVATWIGVLDPDSLVRTSDKTFRLMKQALAGTGEATALTESDDAMSIVVGLWGLGFYEAENALSVMIRFAQSGTLQQKRAAAFYNINIYYGRLQRRFANKLMENINGDIELTAAVFATYMTGCNSRAYAASGGWGDKREKPKPVDIKNWFDSEEEAARHMQILRGLLAVMKHKKYVFNPHLFPWYMVDITRGQVMIKISALANGLGDGDVMDEMAARLENFDGRSGERSVRARLLFSPRLSPVRRKRLVSALADKETYTRREAFYTAQKLSFTPREYDEMCAMLRFKNRDLRLNIITLIKKQDDEGLCRSLEILLTDKKEDMRLAGLDIVKWLEDEHKNGRALDTGKKLAASIPSATQREDALLKDILGGRSRSAEENPLYSDKDVIDLPRITRNSADYPIFKISRERLSRLFGRLDSLIDSYKDYEVKTAYGEKVLLTQANGLPRMKYTGTPEEVYPLTDVWKKFYADNVNGEEELMAMLMALTSRNVQINSNAGNACDGYNRYLRTLSEKLFGKEVTEFDRSVYKYGKNRSSGMFFYYTDNLLRRVVKLMADMLIGSEYRFAFGLKTARYLCRQVPKEKRGQTIHYKVGSVNKQEYVTPLNARIFSTSVDFMSDNRCSSRQWKERFETLYALNRLYTKQDGEPGGDFKGGKPLRSLDYVSGAYYGAITTAQMFRGIFEDGSLRDKLNSLFAVYRAQRWKGLQKTIEKYGIYKNEKLKEFLLDAADKVADRIVSVECRRTDSPTEYSSAVTSIEYFCGTDHLASLLTALGDDKFVRRDSFGFSFGSSGSKRVNLCHLVSVCHPRPGEDADTLAKALSGRNISEKRLIETAMYAPQWLEIVEKYLSFTGLTTGAYYFIAHMNDRYGTDRRRFAQISRFTPLEKQELLDGAFDIDWFYEAYEILGEKRFDMLYDAAKYISDGSRHTRARKYADAALGRVSTGRLEEEIKAKRNKDLLMSYPLVPLTGRRDMLHRYQFIQQFRKESAQFGSQRRASEGTACDMALRNLATRAGFKDTTRLILAMENDLAESMKECFEYRTVTAGGRTVSLRLSLPENGRSKLEVMKDGKNCPHCRRHSKKMNMR